MVGGIHQREGAARIAPPPIDDDREVAVARMLLYRAQVALSKAYSEALCMGRLDQRLIDLERSVRTAYCDVVAYQAEREAGR